MHLHAVCTRDHHARKRKGGGGFCSKRKKEQVQTMETQILETTLVKLGSLLALGLGEAGVDIVGNALRAEEFNPSKGASKIDGIFGFCETYNFMDATEVLQGKVMLFVNQVAEIVHAMVDEFHGFPNKNIGEAFLVVWKVDKDDLDTCQRYADLSLMFGIKLMASVHKSPVLWEYRGHPGLIARIRDFRVTLGLGLHAGWAVEGALGSEFKIDATYLSPDVNLAGRLAAATRHYRTPIIFSQSLDALLTKPMKEYTRWIDSITVVGSKHALKVFTVDLRVNMLEMEPIYATEFHKVHSLRSFEKLRIRRELRKYRHTRREFRIDQFFTNDEDMVAMRKGYTSSFFQIFEKGVLNYEAGEWEIAHAAIEKANQIYRTALNEEDGPGLALMNFMAATNKCPPEGWHGYRELSDE
jgi:class 3 adenylate cyclase